MEKNSVVPGLKGVKLGTNTPVELSKWLKKYLNQDDRREISHKSTISIHTVKSLIYGYTTINEGNYPTLLMLVKLAKENCERENKLSRKARKYFKNILSV